MALLSDSEDLRRRVQRKAGSPVGISEDEIRDAIEDCISDLRRVAGASTETDRTLTTVAGQQAYAIDSDVIEVTDVLWPISVSGFSAEFGPGFGNLLPMGPGMPPFQSRSDQLIDEIERHQAGDIASTAPSWFVRDRNVYLIPVPSSGGQSVPVVCLVDGAVSGIDDRNREVLVVGAAMRVVETMIGVSIQDVDISSAESKPARRSDSERWEALHGVLKERYESLKLDFWKGSTR